MYTSDLIIMPKDAAVDLPAPVELPANVFAETVTSVTHYTDTLFAFRITRPASFRFRSGEFVMIGLMIDGKPLFRAYSVASPSWDEELEFYSIKVPDGPLTSHLQNIEVGDTVLMRKKPTGTLVNDALIGGKALNPVLSATRISIGLLGRPVGPIAAAVKAGLA